MALALPLNWLVARLGLGYVLPAGKAGGEMIRGLLAFALLGAVGLWSGDAAAQNCPGGLMSEEWKECKRAVLRMCAYVGPRESADCEAVALQRYLQMKRVQHQQRLGAVSPATARHCPSTHIIKGNFTSPSHASRFTPCDQVTLISPTR